MEEDVFTGKMDFALWRKMLRFALPHKGKILSVMALGASVSCFDMCLPYMTGRIVDTVSVPQGAAADLHRIHIASMAASSSASSRVFSASS